MQLGGKSVPFEAILVSDMQVGFMERLPNLPFRLTGLLEQVPPENLYFTQFHNHAESLFHTEQQWGRFHDSADTAIVPELQKFVQPNHAFKKYGYLLPEGLLLALGEYKSVGIVGVNTDICVLTAAYCLWDRDIRPYVLADYCASVKGDFYHNGALDLMNRPFGPQTIIRGLF